MSMTRAIVRDTHRPMVRSILLGTSSLTNFDVNGVAATLALNFAGDEYVVGGERMSFLAALTASPPALDYTALSTSTMTNSVGNIVTVPAGQPRIGHHVYNGSVWVNEGLLLESEARTNLEVQSNPASPTTWNTNNLDYSGQTLRITGPDGVADSMFKLQERASNTGHYFFASTTVPVGTITFSCIVKDAGDGRFVYFRTNNDGPNKYINYNPATASITEVGNSVLGYGVIDLGNGFNRIWFSCDNTDGTSGWVIASTNTATPGNNLSNQTFAGTFEAGFYVGFVQVEAGATPSSYIPTSGSTVTRAAQTLTAHPAAFGWNSSAVSVQMDGRISYADQGIGGSGSGGAGEAVFYSWKSNISNYAETYLGTDSSRTGMPVFNQKSAGTRDFVLGGSTTYSPGTLVPFNIAARHGSTFVNGAANGSAYTANTTPSSLADLSATDLQIGFKFMGTIKLFRQFADDIGDDGLEEATT